MKNLIDMFFDWVDRFEKKQWYSSDIFNPYATPKPIEITREKAISIGIDPDFRKGKGHYCVVNGVRVPVNIVN
jgi:hypothetical protein